MPSILPKTGLVRGLLFGQGRRALESAERPIISATGALMGADKSTKGGLGTRLINGVKEMAIGRHPITQTRQRFIQGGLLGKGGLIHGPMALDPEFVSLMQREGGFMGAMKRDPGTAIAGGIGAAVTPTFFAGLPAYSAYKAHQRGESMAGPIAEGLGFTVAAPFGIAAAAPAAALKHLGEHFLPGTGIPTTPQMNQFAQPGLDMGYDAAAEMGKYSSAHCLGPCTVDGDVRLLPPVM